MKGSGRILSRFARSSSGAARRPGLIPGLIFAMFVLGWLAMTSCLVNRRSEGFVCSTNSDCDADRICDNGYCVAVPCPSPCTACDLVAQTCRIDCSGAQPCSAVQCPAGFDCTINCNNLNACGNIDCSQSRSCDINCSGQSSCGGIRCGMGPCDISCNGSSSCPNIDCADSCRCDVICGNPHSNVCPVVSCPLDDMGTSCTGGIAGDPCDSTAGAGCGVCP